MRVVRISDTTAEQWNAFVSRWPYFALMQSYEWGTFKQTAGWKPIRLAVEQAGEFVAGAQVLIKALPLGFASIAYVPRGPLLDWEDQDTAQLLLASMHSSAKRHRAISLKIEPAAPHSLELQARLQAYGFRPSSFSNNPRCSMLIDLRPSLDALLAQMHKTTRYNVRYSARNGVQVREVTKDDLGVVYRLMEDVAARSGVSPRLESYYRQEWNALVPPGHLKTFLATYDGEVLAMRSPATLGTIAATLHSASFDTYRELKPNELLMWESIKWAKSRGCTVYDVWGIPDEVGEHEILGRPLPQDQRGGLWGVYDFKRGFGGKTVYYIGTHDYVYSRLIHWLMNTAISRLGSLDKLASLGDRAGLG